MPLKQVETFLQHVRRESHDAAFCLNGSTVLHPVMLGLNLASKMRTGNLHSQKTSVNISYDGNQITISWDAKISQRFGSKKEGYCRVPIDTFGKIISKTFAGMKFPQNNDDFVQRLCRVVETANT